MASKYALCSFTNGCSGGFFSLGLLVLALQRGHFLFIFPLAVCSVTSPVPPQYGHFDLSLGGSIVGILVYLRYRF